MTQEEIENLATVYAKALDNEFLAISAKVAAQSAQDNARDSVLSGAYADGRIDGKNAETRKAQEAGVLVNASVYQDAHKELWLAEQALARTEVERKRIEMLCSLIRAWLYSQGGKL